MFMDKKICRMAGVRKQPRSPTATKHTYFIQL
jgi:hypothetical protein